MHVKIQPIITGTTISNWIYSFDHILPNIRWLQFGWTFLPNATIRAKLWHKVCWTVIPGQSEAADLEVTMVPAWVLQQTGTMITLGSPAAVRSQYQARDSGYLTLCSACSGYADFRQPLHAEQRINIHPSYSLSIHQRRRHWQGHDPCCAVAYRQQKSYSFQPPFASKRPFHHLDQKLEHLRHW